MHNTLKSIAAQFLNHFDTDRHTVILPAQPITVPLSITLHIVCVLSTRLIPTLNHIRIESRNAKCNVAMQMNDI